MLHRHYQQQSQKLL